MTSRMRRRRPVSSSASRRAASAVRSPGWIDPPGKLHCSRAGSLSRRTRRTELPSSATTPAAATGGGGRFGVFCFMTLDRPSGSLDRLATAPAGAVAVTPNGRPASYRNGWSLVGAGQPFRRHAQHGHLPPCTLLAVGLYRHGNHGLAAFELGDAGRPFGVTATAPAGAVASRSKLPDGRSSVMKQKTPNLPPPPVAAAGVVALDGNSVLLVRRDKDPAREQWSFPGGSIHPGERTADAARREAEEETGLRLRILDVIGIYDGIYSGSGQQPGFH